MIPEAHFNIFGIHEKFSTEQASVTFLQDVGILRYAFFCSRCSCWMNMNKDCSRLDGCILRCPTCRKTKSVRAGSLLEKAKLSARQFIWLLYFWSTQDSTKQIQTHLNLSKPTIVDWTNFIREVCSWQLLRLNQKVGGVGRIVQIDESLIYKAKYNLGHALFATKKWILGFYDVNAKIGFVRFLQDRSAEELTQLILEHVHPGTEIHTDRWRGYNSISELDVEPRYIHKTVNHSENFVDLETGCHTNNVEAFWSSLKLKFKKMNGTSFEKTPGYLDEHEYIKRYGPEPNKLFTSIISHISEKYIFE